MNTHSKHLSFLFAAVAATVMTIQAGCGNTRDNTNAKPSTPGSVSEIGGERLGQVTTATKVLGSNHRIVVDEFKDPKVEGITIYISKAETGGLSGDLGLAEDSSDASVAVRQTGPIRIKSNFDMTERVFEEDRSVLFKSLKLTRMWDADDKTFVYLTHSSKMVDGSPKNSVSAVVAQTWNGIEPDFSIIDPDQPSVEP